MRGKGVGIRESKKGVFKSDIRRERDGKLRQAKEEHGDKYGNT